MLKLEICLASFKSEDFSVLLQQKNEPQLEIIHLDTFRSFTATYLAPTIALQSAPSFKYKTPVLADTIQFNSSVRGDFWTN